MVSVFDYYGNKRFLKGQNDGEHTDDVSTQNYTEIVLDLLIS